ncbi:hypothetical protein AYI70_g7921 [Smittium culicis]|uniref:Mediator of RNA polymerase II transcription subunit 27 n=1 Tax=Smittium culicis TaxID=133412 RepID=A0A1R1XIA1_9FUNG|nr:hypothetical protein AYI70_g7921 [Smittium culicis]
MEIESHTEPKNDPSNIVENLEGSLSKIFKIKNEFEELKYEILLPNRLRKDKFQKSDDEIFTYFDNLENPNFAQIYISSVIGLKIGLKQLSSTDESPTINITDPRTAAMSKLGSSRYNVNYLAVSKSPISQGFLLSRKSSKNSTSLLPKKFNPDYFQNSHSDNNSGNKIYELIQSQVSNKWNKSLISGDLEIFSLQKIISWFLNYKTLFTSPCDNCSRILKHEPVLGLWIPPIVRIDSKDTTHTSSSHLNFKNMNATSIHPSCAE